MLQHICEATPLINERQFPDCVTLELQLTMLSPEQQTKFVVTAAPD